MVRGGSQDSICRCDCMFTCTKPEDLRTHVENEHHNQRYRWCCNGCKKEWNAYRDIYQHLRRCRFQSHNHKTVRCFRKAEIHENVELDEFELLSGDPSPEPGRLQEVVRDVDPNSAAVGSSVTAEQKARSLLLQMTSVLAGKFKVSEDAMNYMFHSMKEVEKVRSEGEINNLCLLHQFSSSYKRNKLLLSEGGLVPPRPVVVGMGMKRDKDNKLVKQPLIAYCIPLEESLRMILRNQFVLDAVMESHTRRDDSSGLLDGNVRGEGGEIVELKLAMSVDDVEFAVPIGQARVKHKQTVASFHILNLPCHWRSKDQSKHLLFICNSNYFNKKERADAYLLADLISVIKKSANGIQLVEGSSQLFRVTLDQVTADAEALASLLKMKRTGPKTKRPCWACDVQSHELQWVFDVSDRVKRDVESHNRDCQKLSHGPWNKKERIKESMKTGVNGRSALLDIPGFDFSKICYDPMHTVLEGGILELGLRDLIRSLVTSNVISLKELNARIRNWHYDLQPGDTKPPDIPDRVLEGGSLGFKAKACITLAENILLIIRDKRSVARKHFIQFARCLRVSQALLEAPVWSEVNIEVLRVQYIRWLATRLSWYGWATITPKCHFVLHMKDQILRHGPTKNQSCMQWERKYKVLKSKKLMCFKNVSWTLALYHAKWQLATLFLLRNGTIEGKSFEDEIIAGKKMKHYDVGLDIRRDFSLELMTWEAYSTVKEGSVRYKAGDILDLGKCEDWEPDFAKIETFLKSDRGWKVIVRHVHISRFETDLGRFVGQPAELEMLDFSNLPYKLIQPTFKEDNYFYICRKYAAAVEVF